MFVLGGEVVCCSFFEITFWKIKISSLAQVSENSWIMKPMEIIGITLLG